MTQGINDEFEKLVRTNPQLACQFQLMTHSRINEMRKVTFHGAPSSQISDTEVLQFGLDYFASIQNGRTKEEILRDIGTFARERGVSFNQGKLEDEIGTLSTMFAREGFQKSLDDATRSTGAPKECLLM